jgi:hypothetical protein
VDIGKKVVEIITGRYGMGTSEQNEVVDTILGEKYAKERFEIYFHWYNILHELGHSIMFFNTDVRPHMVNEEQIVNDFAVAYWLYYGEDEKINSLNEIISYALAHLKCPAPTGVTHIEYAHEKWGTQDFNTFNDYGWFQFNCVKDSLRERKNLASVLTQMGIKNIQVQPQKTIIYSVINEDTAIKVIEDAVPTMLKWGVILPEAYVIFDNDPNRHMCNIIDI